MAGCNRLPSEAREHLYVERSKATIACSQLQYVVYYRQINTVGCPTNGVRRRPLPVPPGCINLRWYYVPPMAVTGGGCNKKTHGRTVEVGDCPYCDVCTHASKPDRRSCCEHQDLKIRFLQKTTKKRFHCPRHLSIKPK